MRRFNRSLRSIRVAPCYHCNTLTPSPRPGPGPAPLFLRTGIRGRVTNRSRILLSWTCIARRTRTRYRVRLASSILPRDRRPRRSAASLLCLLSECSLLIGRPRPIMRDMTSFPRPARTPGRVCGGGATIGGTECESGSRSVADKIPGNKIDLTAYLFVCANNK